MTGPTTKTRQLVCLRDNFHCQWCGGYVDVQSGWYSLQHRRARGMGGSKQDWINSPGNLVLVHGTGTTQCHGEIESHPVEAAGRGFRLGIGQHPDSDPIEDSDGDRWILSSRGTKIAYAIPPSGKETTT